LYSYEMVAAPVVESVLNGYNGRAVQVEHSRPIA
jgi:hypothetical protein